MLVPDLQLSIRSQVRKGELRTAKLRMLRALANAHLHRPAGLIDTRGPRRSPGMPELRTRLDPVVVRPRTDLTSS